LSVVELYNFQRTHQGIDGLVPADRYFGAGSEVLETLKKRVAANAVELARHGLPKKPFYLTGQVGDKSFSLHAEGERVILKRQGEERQEVELFNPEGEPSTEPVWQQTLPEPICPNGSPLPVPDEPSAPSVEAPGSSPLDQVLPQLREAFSAESDGDGEGGAP
jgi:hypothetical protein